VFTPSGHADLVGSEAEAAREHLTCQAGTVSYPLELCEERYLVPGLLSMVLSRDWSYLDP
jgi:hypothetical protein